MEIPRVFNPLKSLEKKSYFLFGPRATGKTTLLNHLSAMGIPSVNLLQAKYFLPLSGDPSHLRQLIGKSKMVIIDEIQKLPILLDEVHDLVEKEKIHFLLTGSSARKLKQENANMLGGRASKISFFPFIWKELNEANKFDLNRVLRFGTLPRVYLAEDPQQELDDYVDVYLREEILLEAKVRKLPEFSRFLKLAALGIGQLQNYAGIASDVGGISSQSIKSYFEILHDTLLGFTLEPWKSGRSRKSVSAAKHYFFDCGVVHTLTGTKHLERNSSLYGDCFEQFLLNEVRAYISYQRLRTELTFWRTQHGEEVDLIIDDAIALEFKATQRVGRDDWKGLRKIGDECEWKDRILVSQDPLPRTLEKNLRSLHWEEFLRELWSGKIISK